MLAGAAASLAVASLPARPAGAQTDYYNTDAGRPITVEDAYPVELRALELQLAPLRLERARGGRYQWGVAPEVAFGILPRTQVEAGLPFAHVDAGRGRSSTGLAGLELSVLHNLNVETSIPALAVAADLLLPVGAFGPERTYASVTGIATRTLPWARFHLNARYTIGERLAAPESEDDASVAAELSRWQAGVAVDRAFPLRSLLVTGEVVATQPLRADERVAWSTAGGARYQLSPRVAADGGAGYRFTGDDRGWFATLGAAVVVGLPWRAR